MSETLVRVTNITERERVVSWDGMPYAIPAGGHRDVSEMLGKHFQKRHAEGVTVAVLTALHDGPEAVPQTRKCHLCGIELADTEEFIMHLGPCAIAHALEQKPETPPKQPAPERVRVMLQGQNKEAVLVGSGRTGFKRVRLLDTDEVLEVPTKTISPLG